MHFLSCYGSLETTQKCWLQLIAAMAPLALVGLGPLLDLKDMGQSTWKSSLCSTSLMLVQQLE